jgi:hypothetical protein
LSYLPITYLTIMSTSDVLQTGEADRVTQQTSISDVSNHSEVLEESMLPLLPRPAWNSQVALLRVLFKTKKALDRIETEAGVLKIPG